MTEDVDKGILSFGVSAETGRPIASPDIGHVAELAKGGAPGATAARRRQANITQGVAGVADLDDLAKTGWAVLFAQDDPRVEEIEAALSPLIESRRGSSAGLFAVLKGSAGYRRGMDATAWLRSRGLTLDVVDPSKGLPFYVLLIGSPELIPLSFQYRLDIFWAVGRLDFPDVADYAAYAHSVVEYENAPGTVPTSRRLALFAPKHNFDPATQLFHRTVVAGAEAAQPPNRFVWRKALGEDATKSAYAALVSGDGGAGTPALIFSGGHGMEFPLGDERQADGQGALVCQDWAGYGTIGPEAWFTGADLPEGAALHGTIHFVFACYGGGCSRMDTFRERDGTALQLAEKDRTAALPRALLLHPNGGALAVVAHVDRAFSCSIAASNGKPQWQGIKDVLWALMRGQRVGNALDRFNARWGAISTLLAEALRPEDGGEPADDERLYQLWISRDDARNYVLLGDPAACLRVDAMA